MSKTPAKKSALFYFGFSAKRPQECSDSETETELPTVSTAESASDTSSDCTAIGSVSVANVDRAVWSAATTAGGGGVTAILGQCPLKKSRSCPTVTNAG